MGLKKIRHRQFFWWVKYLKGHVEVPGCVPYSLYQLGSKFGLVISWNFSGIGNLFVRILCHLQDGILVKHSNPATKLLGTLPPPPPPFSPSSSLISCGGGSFHLGSIDTSFWVSYTSRWLILEESFSTTKGFLVIQMLYKLDWI